MDGRCRSAASPLICWLEVAPRASGWLFKVGQRKPDAVTIPKKDKLVNLKKILSEEHLKVEGSGVVIPRVCNPNPNKIALLDGTHTYTLSDCVIVLRTATVEDAEQVRTHILNNWQDFTTIYKGTGAQYTTLARVKHLFWRR